MLIYVLLSQISIPVNQHTPHQEPAGRWIIREFSFSRYEEKTDRWKANGMKVGDEIHLYGKMESLQNVPVAYLHIDTGKIPDSIILYIRGKGKYRLRLIFGRNGQILSRERVIEASEKWKQVVLTTDNGLSIVGGLMEKPDMKMSPTLYIMPYYTKDSLHTEEMFFDLHVSPVFVR